MTQATSPTVDPRVEHSRRVICDAALIEFAEHGFDDMTIEGVAARAGVGKSTIYRHWDSRSDLMESAIRSIAIDPCHRPIAIDPIAIDSAEPSCNAP